MDDKIGMPLDEIHMSGNVPKCGCFYGVIKFYMAHSLTCYLSQGETRHEHGAVPQTHASG